MRVQRENKSVKKEKNVFIDKWETNMYNLSELRDRKENLHVF